MSYSYQFSEYPTKEIDAMWEELFSGKLAPHRKKVVAQLEADLKATEGLPVFDKHISDFDLMRMRMHEREKYDVLSANGARIWELREELARWVALEKAVSELTTEVTSKKPDREVALEKVAAVSLAMNAIVGKECTSFGESARDRDYTFLDELYGRMMGTRLSELKHEVLTQDWVTFFRSLSKDILLEEMTKAMDGDRIKPEEREEKRNWYLRLLFQIRDELKLCLEKGWDLDFWVEFWEYENEDEQFWTASYRKRRAAYYERLLKTPNFG